MIRFPRIAVLFYSFFITFVVILLVLLFSNTGEESFIVLLLHTSFLNIPMVIYVFTFSLIVAILTYGMVSWSERNYDKQVEENLHYLVRQEYDKVIHFEMTEGAALSTNVQIHQSIHLLAEKLRLMNEQLQQLSLEQVKVGTESREEILRQERLRLSRELHDSVSQQLFAAMMILSGLNEQASASDENPVFTKQLATVTDVINTAQSEMRALLLHLRPIELSGKSLKQGIEQLLRELETKIKIKLKWDIEDVALTTAIEDHLFRIMQELLSNTLRHAKADELEVYLHKVGAAVVLKVIDDGVGFDMQEEKSASYGLINIRERVLGMGGEVKIISFKGQGTGVEIRVPIIIEEKND
ncbi:two-component system, NarL family, sensor histidine kinase LiaS [Pilibacter termitis]|uniref:Sensor histidine kinase n=1 Tax=Pilibacter termitis TaxID=263852 RepID=A0A1T4MYL4_9ENTE|nr:sensor histidine kinase [Pilibacter termitis]SJZ71845.1 two-component system, NarL family, sensor histidine kinase LiaS [Pilibacter termitis]